MVVFIHFNVSPSFYSYTTFVLSLSLLLFRDMYKYSYGWRKCSFQSPTFHLYHLYSLLFCAIFIYFIYLFVFLPQLNLNLHQISHFIQIYIKFKLLVSPFLLFPTFFRLPLDNFPYFSSYVLRLKIPQLILSAQSQLHKL